MVGSCVCASVHFNFGAGPLNPANPVIPNPRSRAGYQHGACRGVRNPTTAITAS